MLSLSRVTSGSSRAMSAGVPLKASIRDSFFVMPLE